MQRVFVKWARNTAEALGRDSSEWTVTDVNIDGDEIELWGETEAHTDQLIAKFGKHDTDVFLVTELK